MGLLCVLGTCFVDAAVRPDRGRFGPMRFSVLIAEPADAAADEYNDGQQRPQPELIPASSRLNCSVVLGFWPIASF